MTERTRQFMQLWKAGVTTVRIAQAIGVSQRHVRRLRAELKLVPRKGGRPGAGPSVDRDAFPDVGRALHGVFKGALKRRLDDFARRSRGEMTPAQKKGLQKIAAILDDLSKTADSYAAKFRAISRPAKRAR